MGIPAVDILATYSFAQAHPYYTALIVAASLALAAFVMWFVGKYPKHAGKLRLATIVAGLAFAVPGYLAATKPAPSPILEWLNQVNQGSIKPAPSPILEHQGVAQPDETK